MGVVIETGHTGTYGINHPRIGWNSTGKRGAVVVSSEAAGYAGVNAVDPMTHNYWKPTALPATFEIATASAETINYCGIAAHNLSGAGCTVYFETYEGAAWVEKANVAPVSDAAIMFLCDDVSTARARIRITGTLPPNIGVVYFGQAIELARPTYQGYTPIDLAQTVEFKTNRTNGGQFAGRSVKRTGAQTQFTVNNLEESYVRANLLGWFQEARTRPFFLAERPGGYPDAVDYVFTEGEIQPQRTGPRDLMSISI